MSDNDYAEAQQRFAANLQTAEAELKNAGADPNTGFAPGQVHHSQLPQPTIDVEKMAEADRLQQFQDEKGKRPYLTDPAYRNGVEQMRREAFGAAPVAAAPTEPVAPVEPVEPTGSPAERLISEVSERLESGDIIQPDEYTPELFAELSASYSIADLLPAGFGIGATEAMQLRAAKKAGVSETVIRTIVAEMVKAQQQD